MNNMNFTKNAFVNANANAKIVPPSGGTRVTINTEMGRTSTTEIRSNLEHAYKENDNRFRSNMNHTPSVNTQDNINKTPNINIQNNMNHTPNINIQNSMHNNMNNFNRNNK